MAFHDLIKSSKPGWVEVIPYNNSFAFLHDSAGGYDFIFKGLRDSLLTISSTDEHDTVMANDEDRAFEAWIYFKYTGWREQDEHEAEQKFYVAGGTTAMYPGSSAILRNHLTNGGKYAPSQTKPESGIHLTDLITIRAFRKYIAESGKFGKATGNDPWLYANGNREEDDSLPASVTWQEAVDYVQWRNGKGKLKYRLPKEDEYREEFAKLIPAQISAHDVKKALEQSLVEFISPEGQVYDGHPPYMNQDDFGRLTLRYRRPVPTEGGVVRSAYFGEWLEPEGSAINGLFFCAQFQVCCAHEVIVSPARARLPLDTTGKYKSMKIGFRLAILE